MTPATDIINQAVEKERPLMDRRKRDRKEAHADQHYVSVLYELLHQERRHGADLMRLRAEEAAYLRSLKAIAADPQSHSRVCALVEDHADQHYKALLIETQIAAATIEAGDYLCENLERDGWDDDAT